MGTQMPGISGSPALDAEGGAPSPGLPATGRPEVPSPRPGPPTERTGGPPSAPGATGPGEPPTGAGPGRPRRPLPGTALPGWEEDEDEDHDVTDLAPEDRPTSRDGRAWHIVALPDDDDPTDLPGEWQDVLAVEVGGRGEVSAEEAAMHLVGDGDGGLTDHEDEYGPLWDERR